MQEKLSVAGSVDYNVFEETKASAIAVTCPGAAQAIPELSEVVR